MGEDKSGAGDVADRAGAGGDVLKDPPAAFEQGESAFAEASQGAQEPVVGAVVRAESLVSLRLLDGRVNADPGAVVVAVGEGGQAGRGCGVQGAEHVRAGSGQVVHRARLDLGDPQREPVGRREGCRLPACWWALPEYQASMGSPLTLMICSAQRSVRIREPSRIT